MMRRLLSDSIYTHMHTCVYMEWELRHCAVLTPAWLVRCCDGADQGPAGTERVRVYRQKHRRSSVLTKPHSQWVQHSAVLSYSSSRTT